MSDEFQKIPKGWVWITIEEVSELVQDGNYGESYPKKDEWVNEGIPFLTAAVLGGNGEIIKSKLKFITPKKQAQLTKAQIRNGDIIFPNRGARDAQTIGLEPLAFLVPNDFQEANINPQLTLVRADLRIVSPLFLVAALNSPMFLAQFREVTTGSALRFINLTTTKKMLLPIPPLDEQRRIVAKLEKLLAKVDTCKQRLDKIPGILKRFRQSVLSAACSGRLTADWRENNPDVEPASELLKRIHIERRRRWEESELETISANGKIPKDDKWKFRYKEPEPVNVEDLPELPNNWHWTNLQSIAVVKDPNPSHRYPSYEDGTVPLLSTREFRGLNDWQTELSPLVSEEVYQFQNKICEFSTNDIIFARKGKLGLARRPPKLPKYTFSHTIFIIKCFEGICSDSILWYLRQDKAVEWLLREMNSNTGVPTLGKAITEQLPIPLAPIAEQQEIVNRIETLFKTADQIEQRYQKAKSYINQLTQSILAKAFRGELVPQDPNDEPASVLLERIRAERENRENVAKTAKKPAANKKQRSKKAQPQLEPTPPVEPTPQSEPIQLELPLFD